MGAIVCAVRVCVIQEGAIWRCAVKGGWNLERCNLIKVQLGGSNQWGSIILGFNQWTTILDWSRSWSCHNLVIGPVLVFAFIFFRSCYGLILILNIFLVL